ncbi:MAG: hypothetical protein HZB62_09580 [Nitrospirae bacterium]|nr:hypothetical protein [Nitrospirota bacterium]
MRQLKLIIAVVMALGLMHAPGIGQDQSAEKKKSVSPSEVKTDSGEAAKTTDSSFHQKKERYQKKAEEKLLRFEDKLKRLYVRVEKRGLKAKEKISHAGDDLKKKSESAKNKLNAMKESGEEKWEKARGELDSLLKDLEHSYNRTAAKFKD